MTIEPGVIAKLRKAVEDANAVVGAAETRAQAADEEVARALAQLLAEFGVDTLEEAVTLLLQEEAALALDVAALTAATDAALGAAKALPA